jgi:hypothetical protein
MGLAGLGGTQVLSRLAGAYVDGALFKSHRHYRTEHLAFHPIEEGEADIPVVFADPLPIVIDALQACTDWQTLYDGLPDLELIST